MNNNIKISDTISLKFVNLNELIKLSFTIVIFNHFSLLILNFLLAPLGSLHQVCLI